MQNTGKKVTPTELGEFLTGRELRLYEIKAIRDVVTAAELLDAKKYRSSHRIYLVSVIV
jgi:hypothetical protein